MNIPPTKPGQRCRVIGSRMAFNNEGDSGVIGTIVETMFMHDQKAGIEQENVWHCKAVEGQIKTYYGAGPEADFLECWLDLLPPDATPPTHAEVRKAVSA